jgi:hypothetical protein
MIRKRSLQPLQAHIRTAQNGLPHIIKAMNHMPVMVLFQLVIGLECRVGLHDGKETVQLVRHGCRKDCGVGPDDGRGEVVVGGWIGNGLETHANGHQFVPGSERFWLEEIRGIVRGKSLVYSKSGDLCRDLFMPGQLKNHFMNALCSDLCKRDEPTYCEVPNPSCRLPLHTRSYSSTTD